VLVPVRLGACPGAAPRHAFGRAKHELVHRKNPRGRVLYVANDPYVLLHAQSLLEVDERVRVIKANIYRPREILEHEDARGFLDWGQPIGLVYGDAWIHDAAARAPAVAVMPQEGAVEVGTALTGH
jgi:hypothetical protein